MWFIDRKILKYLIDNTGSVYKPEQSASYWYNTDQNFGSDTPVAVAIYNGSGSFNQDFETTVYQPLKRFETIIHSDTGSYNSLFLKSGFIPTMSFTSIGGFLTNVETYIKNVPNGDYVPVNFEGIKYSTIIKNLEELKKILINILEKIETFKEFNLLKYLEENNFGQIIKDINEFSSIKGISENLNEEKFDNFLQDLIEQVNNLKLESKLKDAEESLSKNMNEAQYNELLSLKDQIVASKKV